MASGIDPKQLILSNKLLVVTYTIAVVPVVLSVVMLGSLATEVQQAQQKLKRDQNQLNAWFQQLEDKENPLRTEEDKARLEKRKGLYEEELSHLGDVVAERDAPLERWFDRFKDQKDPEFNDYVEEWRQKQIPKLKEDYASLIQNGGEALLFVDVPGRSELREFQKKFWIEKAILEALRKGGAEGLVNPGLDFQSTRQGPDDAFTVQPVRLSVRCTFPKLPNLIRELLSCDITTRVKGLEVRKSNFDFVHNNLEINGSRKVFLNYAYGERLAKGDPVPANPAEVITEPAVHVDIELEVYDFGKNDDDAGKKE